MKKVFLFASLAFCLMTSCKKENSAVSSNMTGTTPNAKILAKSSMTDAETERIIEALTNWDAQVSLAQNLAFGMQDPDPTQDYTLRAAYSAANLQMWIDGTLYKQNSTRNQWSYRGDGLDKYYGKTVHVKISNGTDSVVQDIYIPAPLDVKGLYTPGTTLNLVARSGNTFKWSPDPKNPTGKMAIAYQLYRDGKNSEPIGDMQYLIVDDNGSFDMDPFITSETQGYEITLCRGNAMSFQDGDTKFLFNFTSTDVHNYLIVN